MLIDSVVGVNFLVIAAEARTVNTLLGIMDSTVAAIFCSCHDKPENTLQRETVPSQMLDRQTKELLCPLGHQGVQLLSGQEELKVNKREGVVATI